MEENKKTELPGECSREGFLAEPEEEKKAARPLLGKVRQNSEKISMLAFLFSVVTWLCLHENADGIAVVFWAAGFLALIFFTMKILERPVKKESYWQGGAIMLLALSNMCTLNSFFHVLNWLGIGILVTCLFLNQFYETEMWTIWEYGKNSVLLWIYNIGSVPEPFFFFAKKGKQKEEKSQKAVIAVLTVCACLPVLLVIAILLGSADQVFFRLLKNMVTFSFLRGENWSFLVWILGGFFGFYGLFSSGAKGNLKGGAQRKRWDSFPACVACGLFALLYGVFCIIQIFYLFGGGLFTLPEGLTFSEYARTGFFQLLFVAFFNFCCVMFVEGRFQESRLLKGLLAFVCGCTYIMIGSAAYRMLLYIGQYDLSFLRVLVLWFLILLAVLLGGLLVFMYRKKFSLFRFILYTTLFFWLLLVFSKPDFWIARYNLEYGNGKEQDVDYLYELSWDGAPAVASVQEENPGRSLSYGREILEEYESRSFRQWNLSLWLAKEAWKP